ncbi:hypothetical protein [Glutamicibacter soli]|uniref:Uncharacterized protein n=1 Tax=Glutamicibacter soli TaxID=453836 RepID=A0A6L9G6W1_9MICC|nr:hypothetical protein [Glutamicibacter soli]NAZ16703.1 hypothetical protein [Glutamicibacter soli]
MDLFSWLQEFFNSAWIWMTPGISALASWGAILPALVGFIAALAALRTFKLRARVDHADQWWKRVQYGIELAKSDSTTDQALGSLILGTLDGPQKPWVFKNPHYSKNRNGTLAQPELPLTAKPVESHSSLPDESSNVLGRLRALRHFKKSHRDGWFVSRSEAAMLGAMSRIISDDISGPGKSTTSPENSSDSATVDAREAVWDAILAGLRDIRTKARIRTSASRKRWK